MIKEGNCLRDLKLLAKSDLQSKGTAFHFADITLPPSQIGEYAPLILKCLHPRSVAIFWFSFIVEDYDVLRDVIARSGYVLDVTPAIWCQGESIVSKPYFHSAYLPFVVASPRQTTGPWFAEIKRGNVFYYPGKNGRRMLMMDLLSTFIKEEKGRVIQPNAHDASTVLAAKHLGFEHMIWGSAQARMEAELEWEKFVEKRLDAGQKKGK